MGDRATGPEIDGLVLREHLGSGGYSDVFLYDRRKPRMPVAVKVMRNAQMSRAEARQFSAEAEAMAELADHPYIVQVFSTGTTDDGRPYLVMKYYPQPNLARRAATEPIPVAEVLRTGIKIAGAVETAHRAGIVHRDIKPANILMTSYGQPGLTDFGVSGRAAEFDSEEGLGVSIPWAAPEILSGASRGSVASDVYSLAATLWHLLAGRSPFEAPDGDNSPAALHLRIVSMAPSATGRADVPASLERLLQQTMSRKPAQRPSSALEFALALQVIEQELRYTRTELVVDGWADGRVERRSSTGVGAPDRAEPSAIGSPGAGPVPGEPGAPAASPPAAAGADADAPMIDGPAGPRPDVAGARARSRWQLVGGVAVLIGAILTIVLSTGPAGDGEAGQPPGGRPGIDNGGFAATDVDPPTIEALYEPASGILTFRWSAPPIDGEPARFVYALGGQQIGPTDATTAMIATTDPARTCITVGVVIDRTGQRANREECGP